MAKGNFSQEIQRTFESAMEHVIGYYAEHVGVHGVCRVFAHMEDAHYGAGELKYCIEIEDPDKVEEYYNSFRDATLDQDLFCYDYDLGDDYGTVTVTYIWHKDDDSDSCEEAYAKECSFVSYVENNYGIHFMQDTDRDKGAIYINEDWDVFDNPHYPDICHRQFTF